MTDLPVLDPVEQRVLGCLLEKQVTVPATYPLTLNALRAACNQTSSRDPVMDLDEGTVHDAARALRDRGLLRIVWADTGRRVLKYHQTLQEVLELDADESALLTVLLLRGPQTAGELKTRAERLHAFTDRDDVETCLEGLARRPDPLVTRLDRRPGQHDHRWAHRLGPLPPTTSDTLAEPEVDRESPIAGGAQARDDGVRAAYAAVAADYADRFASELEDLPFERWLLDRVVAEAAGRPVVDAGCGPGHVTAYLAAAGADASGLDLSPEMIRQARERFPGIRYDVGDLTRLIRPPHAAGWGAVLGWYSLIHLAGSEFPGAVAALARPLAPGGVLLLAGHAGRDVLRTTSWLGQEVTLDVVLHDPRDVAAAAAAAGLAPIEWYLRGPVRARQETTERFYLLAWSPGG
ncbi:MAG TPA: DUF480 domain-containing protein [Kineosporiaceae bacterium]